jgi:hypothetical protein
MAALALWNLRDVVKRGRKAERDDRADEITKALLLPTRRAEEAEALLTLKEMRLAEETADKLKAQGEVERLKQKLAERDEIEDRLQSSLNSVQGRLDELERRVPDESPRRGRQH